VPYLSASAVMIHYEGALYQVYAPFTRYRYKVDDATANFPPTQYLGIAVRYPAHLCRPTTGAACNAIALLIADSQDHHHATRAILDRATGVTCQVDTANRTATD